MPRILAICQYFSAQAEQTMLNNSEKQTLRVFMHLLPKSDCKTSNFELNYLTPQTPPKDYNTLLHSLVC